MIDCTHHSLQLKKVLRLKCSVSIVVLSAMTRSITLLNWLTVFFSRKSCSVMWMKIAFTSACPRRVCPCSKQNFRSTIFTNFPEHREIFYHWKNLLYGMYCALPARRNPTDKPTSSISVRVFFTLLLSLSVSVPFSGSSLSSADASSSSCNRSFSCDTKLRS